jgi:hypothetical protein
MVAGFEILLSIVLMNMIIFVVTCRRISIKSPLRRTLVLMKKNEQFHFVWFQKAPLGVWGSLASNPSSEGNNTEPYRTVVAKRSLSCKKAL